MMPIDGRPLLDYGLSTLADAGITDVGLIVAPDHEVIEYSGRRRPPVRVHFSVQPDPLGTANALLAAEDWAAPFLAMNADNLYPPAFSASRGARRARAAGFERGDLWVEQHPGRAVQTFALLEVDAEGYLTGIVEKPSREFVPQGKRAGEHELLALRFPHLQCVPRRRSLRAASSSCRSR